MSRVAPQAQRVIDAVKALGIPRSEWSVRTKTRIFRDGGQRHREYGDAVLYWYSGSAREAIVAAAQQLADAGLCVSLTHGGALVVPVVTSGWNPHHKVTHINL